MALRDILFWQLMKIELEMIKATFCFYKRTFVTVSKVLPEVVCAGSLLFIASATELKTITDRSEAVRSTDEAYAVCVTFETKLLF